MKGLITEEIAHIRGIPRKLIIFLHGYIDNCECLNHRLDSFVESFDNTAVHLPEAPLLCEIHEGKRQWFSMHRFDPDDERKTVPSLDECLAFYERMTPGFEESSGYLNRYIDNCLDLYGLAPEDLYLCGFSQGAMLAIYTALRREENIGGCVSFSGLLTTSRFLKKENTVPRRCCSYTVPRTIWCVSACGMTQRKNCAATAVRLKPIRFLRASTALPKTA